MNDLKVGLGANLADQALSVIRESGQIVVAASPTGAMIKAARRAGATAASLSDAEIEGIYFLMTNAWLDRPTPAKPD
jgi:hypothetical protein